MALISESVWQSTSKALALHLGRSHVNGTNQAAGSFVELLLAELLSGLDCRNQI